MFLSSFIFIHQRNLQSTLMIARPQEPTRPKHNLKVLSFGIDLTASIRQNERFFSCQSCKNLTRSFLKFLPPCRQSHFRYEFHRTRPAINGNSSLKTNKAWYKLLKSKAEVNPLDQGGKRPGGETGSPLLVQCVMRRRTGTSAPSALPVRLMAAKNFLSTNRKSTFLSLFLSHQWCSFKSLFDVIDPKCNTFMSVVMMLK